MSIDNALASVAVKDLKVAVAWYTRLFERSPDTTPMPEVAEWKFDRGGWLQVHRQPERAGMGSFTLAVTDIEGVVTHVRKLGVDTSQRSTNPRVETLMIVDPDGNHIAFAEAKDRGLAR
jgi:predicted enzyme related to lactoylglutathione lyase